MSTRYVWKRFKNSDLKTNLNWSGNLTGGGGGYSINESSDTVTYCNSYSVSLDSSGHQKFHPLGDTYVYRYTGSEWISCSKYRYCIIENPSYNDIIMSPGTGTNYWFVRYEAKFDKYTASTARENGVVDSTTPVSTYQSGDIPYNTMTQFVYRSSNAQNAYSGDDTYSYLYLGSDNIDPTAISYPASAKPNEKISIKVTASTSGKYGGNLTYLYEISENGEAWDTGWYESAATSISETLGESGTYRFRVRVQDSWGFISTTYITGPLGTITPDFVVSLSVEPNKSGTVSGAGTFSSGTSVTVRATPASGWEFEEWTEGSTTVSTSATYTFTISKDRSLTAVFKQKLALWIGVNGKARKGTDMWVGVNGKARKVVGAWVGVNGKARRFL